MEAELFDAVASNQVELAYSLAKQGASINLRAPGKARSALAEAHASSSRPLVHALLHGSLSRAVATREKETIDQTSLALVDLLLPGSSSSSEQKSLPLPALSESESAATAPATQKDKDDLMTRMGKALNAIRAGEFVVVLDSEDRENEGDLIIAAEKATADKLAFMVNETSGLICVGMTGERIDELRLPQMVQRNSESHQTAFTVSVDYNIGTSTGISAHDRAATIHALADRRCGHELFARPGHIFPLRAKAGGVLERPGHTEASVDLARLAGLFPAGALCEIVNKDGSMTRQKQLYDFAALHKLECITIGDIIEYRRRTEEAPAAAPAAAAAPSL